MGVAAVWCGVEGWKTAGGVGGRPARCDERDHSRSRRCIMTYCSCFAGGHVNNSEGKWDHLGGPLPGRWPPEAKPTATTMRLVAYPPPPPVQRLGRLAKTSVAATDGGRRRR